VKANITFEQAIILSKEIIKEKEQRKLEVLEDIKVSDFSMLDAIDIQYYADILGITPNEVRAIYLAYNKDKTAFDLLNTFNKDDSNDIIDFF